MTMTWSYTKKPIITKVSLCIYIVPLTQVYFLSVNVTLYSTDDYREMSNQSLDWFQTDSRSQDKLFIFNDDSDDRTQVSANVFILT